MLRWPIIFYDVYNYLCKKHIRTNKGVLDLQELSVAVN